MGLSYGGHDMVTFCNFGSLSDRQSWDDQVVTAVLHRPHRLSKGCHEVVSTLSLSIVISTHWQRVVMGWSPGSHYIF